MEENNEIIDETLEKNLTDENINDQNNNNDEKNEIKDQLEQAMEKNFQEVLNEKDEKYKRLFAEFDNFKKRTMKEKQNNLIYAKADVIENMLPIIDALEHAINIDVNDEALKEGLSLIENQIHEFFAKNGVEEIGKVGENFNPEYHQAIVMQESDEVESGKIITVYRKGYKIGDKIIRNAMVIVAK